MRTGTTKRLWVGCALLAAAVGTAAPLAAQDAKDEKDSPKPAALATMADALAPSLVKVEYTPQYDKGEAPDVDRWGAWRAYMAAAASDTTPSYEGWEELIKQERPAERGGYLIAPTRVFTSDPMLHPRFIKSIQVRFGAEVVKATPAAYCTEQSGWILELERPLKDAKALQFDPKAPGPHMALSYEPRDGTWMTMIGGIRGGVAVSEQGRRYSAGSPMTLILTEAGKPVTMTGNGVFPSDESWRTEPSSWAQVSETEMAALLKQIEEHTAGNLLRVTLNFRSPRTTSDSSNPYAHMYGGNGEEDLTEWHGVGVLMDDSTVLVLANFKPKVTGRLERIRVFGKGGEETGATFAGTLKDWGAFTAKLEKPMTGAIRPSSKAITDHRGKLLLKAEISVRGETRTAHFSRDRIAGYTKAHRGQIIPMVEASSGESYGPYGGGDNERLHFLFESDSTIVGLPIERREKVAAEDQGGYFGYAAAGQTVMVPVAAIVETVRAGATAIDPENRPLSEDEENRLAWLGVEMQPMDPDLARANDVVDETRNGQSGALVTYIYENSPATTAGLRVGDILLRLHIQDQPKPLDIHLDAMPDWGGFDFSAMMDQMPEEYFDRMPPPWGTPENSLTRALTDVGFGTPFRAEVFRDGKVESIEFKVEQGPAHYNAAKRFKSNAAGLTVRDVTYEVRRHFQLAADEPGVVVSKVERGGKASIAGIKPFELIVAVNDTPVKSAKELQDLLTPGGEFRMTVKRTTTGRVVKIKIQPESEAKPAEGEGDEGGEEAERP